MNHYHEMRKYLQSLSDDDLIRFVGKLGSDIIFLDDAVYELLLDPPGSQRVLHPSSWRKQKMEEMLACREEHPAEWNRMCWIAQIDSDSARQVGLAEASRRWSIWAIIISVLAFGWQVVESLALK